jgi:hypothetical protein
MQGIKCTRGFKSNASEFRTRGHVSDISITTENYLEKGNKGIYSGTVQ